MRFLSCLFSEGLRKTFWNITAKQLFVTRWIIYVKFDFQIVQNLSMSFFYNPLGFNTPKRHQVGWFRELINYKNLTVHLIVARIITDGSAMQALKSKETLFMQQLNRQRCLLTLIYEVTDISSKKAHFVKEFSPKLITRPVDHEMLENSLHYTNTITLLYKSAVFMKKLGDV